MKPKFQQGDKVRLTRHVPIHVSADLTRARTRTIKSVGYDQTQQHILYELGIQGNGGYHYLFRAWQLKPVLPKEQHIIGRPRQKRQYRNHQWDTS